MVVTARVVDVVIVIVGGGCGFIIREPTACGGTHGQGTLQASDRDEKWGREATGNTGPPAPPASLPRTLGSAS